MKRETAQYSNLKDIINSTYHKGEGEYAPNYVTVNRDGSRLTRVHVWGTVMQKFENETGDFASITIDDSTETIRLNVFAEKTQILKDIKEGDNIDGIGKVREREGEKQIILEAINTITNPNQLLYIRAKIAESNKNREKDPNKTQTPKEPEPAPKPVAEPDTKTETTPEPTKSEEDPFNKTADQTPSEIPKEEQQFYTGSSTKEQNEDTGATRPDVETSEIID